MHQPRQVVPEQDMHAHHGVRGGLAGDVLSGIVRRVRGAQEGAHGGWRADQDQVQADARHGVKNDLVNHEYRVIINCTSTGIFHAT